MRPDDATGPNGDYTGLNYDAAGRLNNTRAPDGETSSVTFTDTYTTKQDAGGPWTTQTADGFGRLKTVTTGQGTGTYTITDYQYAPCACSPSGKLKRVSVPHAAGTQAAKWTTNQYDALGRLIRVDHPAGGSTTYEYGISAGRRWTKVTPPGGRWKTNYLDAFDNLREVDEPRPGAPGAVDRTSYAYDVAGRAVEVSMTRGGVTQSSSTQQMPGLARPAPVIRMSATDDQRTDSGRIERSSTRYRRVCHTNGNRPEHTV